MALVSNNQITKLLNQQSIMQQALQQKQSYLKQLQNAGMNNLLNGINNSAGLLSGMNTTWMGLGHQLGLGQQASQRAGYYDYNTERFVGDINTKLNEMVSCTKVKKETNEDWLDKRVNEMRIKL